MPKVIKTSATPNPLALKFHMDCQVIKNGSRSYTSQESAKGDPVAAALFDTEQVTSVFYINDVVTINKKESADWNELIPIAADILEEKMVSSLEGYASSISSDSGQLSGDVRKNFFELENTLQLQHINALLDETVRPGLAGDGGGLEVVDLVDKQVQIHYEGACGSCPSSTEGTLSFIENTLKTRLHPELSVLAV